MITLQHCREQKSNINVAVLACHSIMVIQLAYSIFFQCLTSLIVLIPYPLSPYTCLAAKSQACIVELALHLGPKQHQILPSLRQHDLQIW